MFNFGSSIAFYYASNYNKPSRGQLAPRGLPTLKNQAPQPLVLRYRDCYQTRKQATSTSGTKARTKTRQFVERALYPAICKKSGIYNGSRVSGANNKSARRLLLLRKGMIVSLNWARHFSVFDFTSPAETRARNRRSKLHYESYLQYMHGARNFPPGNYFQPLYNGEHLWDMHLRHTKHKYKKRNDYFLIVLFASRSWPFV